jgi:hypothetical protein
MVNDTDPVDAVPPEGGAPDAASPGGRLDVPGMLSQLQGMIGKVAHASEPALREVAAKAAELAAVAAEHAGPIAHTLAEKTDEVSHVVAERASGLASSLRAGAPHDTPGSAQDAMGVTDPAEESPRDGA